MNENFKKLFYYDLETTGVLPYRHGIHQISGQITIDDVVREEFDYRVQPNPKAEITPEALAVCGVTKEQILAYPEMSIVYKDLIKTLSKYVDKFNKKDKFHLVGYNNASFDNPFFRGFWKQNNDEYFGSWFWADSIDVMVLASNYLMPVRSTMIDFKLSTVAKQLGIVVDDTKLHDAKYDIFLTSEILRIVNSKK